MLPRSFTEARALSEGPYGAVFSSVAPHPTAKGTEAKHRAAGEPPQQAKKPKPPQTKPNTKRGDPTAHNSSKAGQAHAAGTARSEQRPAKLLKRLCTIAM